MHNQVKIIAMPCMCADIFEHSGEILPGGEALNFAANACRYPHVQVSLMGAIGDDAAGHAILASIVNRPIRQKHIHIVSGGETASHFISLTEKGDRYFKPGAWHSGVFGDYRMDDADRAALLGADWVFCTWYTPNMREVLEERKTGRFKLAVDFNECRDWEQMEAVLPWIDLLLISGTEKDLPVFRAWSEKFGGLFNVTLAANGSVTYHKGQEYRVKAVPVERVIDTTGCGDSYHAGFLCAYVRGDDLIASMNEGSRLASETLAHVGGFL